MSTANIHLVYRNPRTKRANKPDEPPPAAPGGRPRGSKKADSEETDLRFSGSPLGAPVEILRRMPDGAISPALLELIDRMSSPILLFENGTTGNLRQMPAAKPARAMAA